MAVLFLWLAIFPVIPVIHSYFSVKHFEEKLWTQQQFFKIAGDNLNLLKSVEYSNSLWFKRVQGNGTDSMTITYVPVKDEKLTASDKNNYMSNISVKIYAWLYDPLKNGFSHRDFLIAKNQKTNWKLNDNDLAEDGILNRINRKIISQLTEKRVIAFNPYPELHSLEFRNYITDHISRSEIKAIEKKLGLKGNWRNTKYIILLVIIPLAAFIFISHGMTIEKSFGIFAGIVGHSLPR